MAKIDYTYVDKVLDSELLPRSSQKGIYTEARFQKCKRILQWV